MVTELTNRLDFFRPIGEIRNIRDFQPMCFGQGIFFGAGRFDDYCAYTSAEFPDGFYCAMPQDVYYFEILDRVACETNCFFFMYEDIKHIYEHVTDRIDKAQVRRIYRIAQGYGDNHKWMFNALMHVYYGMVAEENKAGTKLGASIKMNGIYRVLIDREQVPVAARECCGVSAGDLRKECMAHRIHKDWDAYGWGCGMS